MVKKTHVV